MTMVKSPSWSPNGTVPYPATAPPEPVLSEVEGLNLTIAHQAWELTGGERCLAALLADARRLAAA